MKKREASPTDTAADIRPFPVWIDPAPAENIETAAFRSGAALGHLALILAAQPLPLPLLRERLALAAAKVCAGLAGRREEAADLRDAVHLLRPGDHPGPAGLIFQQWLHAVGRPVSPGHLAKVIGIGQAGQVAQCLDVSGNTPVGRAAMALEAMLTESPRAETAALILADAVLAQSMGWTHIMPCLALALKPRDLRLRGDALCLACHHAVLAGARQTVPLAADLTRRAMRLRAVVPSLRAKGAGRAVEMFLSRDALAATELCAIMSDRAARRLCDRLVMLGAVQELTGRDSFRLYGV